MRQYLHHILGAVILLASLGGGWFLWDYRVFTSTTLNLGPEGLQFVVDPGSSASRIARDLADLEVLRNPLYFRLMARLGGHAERIRAGEYQLSAGMTPSALLEKLTHGEVILHALTVVEGWTIAQLRAALRSHPAIEQTLQGTEDAEIMERLEQPGEHPEGWFAPETYRFPRGTTDLAFLRRAHQTMRRWLEEEWQGRSGQLPYEKPYEALIMASIIEKETAQEQERAMIAGVFVRRLAKRMRLQTDPTVIYGIGPDFDGNIRRADLQRDTPYNTYVHRGLPPTPIALPGRASLHAALRPEPGDALYFVARGDGSHEFSSTLEAHQEAVRRYQLRR